MYLLLNTKLLPLSKVDPLGKCTVYNSLALAVV